MRDVRWMRLGWAALAALVWSAAGAEAQSWKTVTMSRQLSGERDLDVHVTYGAGRFYVRPAEGGLLYRMQLRYDEDSFEPEVEFVGNDLRLGIDGRSHSIRMGRDQSGGEMDLSLSRRVPMDLTLEFGAVRAELELGGLSLTDLQLSTGASEAVVDISEPNPVEMDEASFEVGAADFTVRGLGNLNTGSLDVDAGVGKVSLWFDGEWRQDMDVDIDIGMGALDIHVPEGLGVHLEKDSFLSSLDAEGMVKRGDSYYSVDWDEAEYRIEINLDAAFGSVRIHWIN
ncbi:MAG: toast rack family protein [Gemmatimonadota bacterium]|nr:toast rack family protein [Gemmatimonadota bacterium]MDH5758130.1 toast rack family protein [Gemmatimonadota bacterium]